MHGNGLQRAPTLKGLNWITEVQGLFAGWEFWGMYVCVWRLHGLPLSAWLSPLPQSLSQCVGVCLCVGGCGRFIFHLTPRLSPFLSNGAFKLCLWNKHIHCCTFSGGQFVTKSEVGISNGQVTNRSEHISLCTNSQNEITTGIIKH